MMCTSIKNRIEHALQAHFLLRTQILTTDWLKEKMLSAARQLLSRNVGKTLESGVISAHTTPTRFKSSLPGRAREASRVRPCNDDAKEDAVGYLDKILNARVYEAAIETDLQEAKNLSAVRPWKKTPSSFKVTMLLLSH
jgi:hypothetical protein